MKQHNTIQKGRVQSNDGNREASSFSEDEIIEIISVQDACQASWFIKEQDFHQYMGLRMTFKFSSNILNTSVNKKVDGILFVSKMTDKLHVCEIVSSPSQVISSARHI